MITKNFNDLIEAYDSFIFDIWGVVYDGVKTYPNTIETLNLLLQRKDKEVVFLSNTPRPHDITFKNLAGMGIDLKLEQVLTSGDIARNYLQSLDQKTKFYHLGKERNQDILRDINNEIVDNIEDADLLLLTAFLDQGDDLNQYDNLLISAAKLGLKALCPNPDKEIMHGDHQRYCAGFFAQKFESFGGTVKYIGKPHQEVYLNIFKQLKNKNLDRILMIGGTLETDILGAQKANISSALTLTGNGRTFATADPSSAVEQACNKLDIQLPTEIIWGVF